MNGHFFDYTHPNKAAFLSPRLCCPPQSVPMGVWSSTPLVPPECPNTVNEVRLSTLVTFVGPVGPMSVTLDVGRVYGQGGVDLGVNMQLTFRESFVKDEADGTEGFATEIVACALDTKCALLDAFQRFTECEFLVPEEVPLTFSVAGKWVSNGPRRASGVPESMDLLYTVPVSVVMLPSPIQGAAASILFDGLDFALQSDGKSAGATSDRFPLLLPIDVGATNPATSAESLRALAAFLGQAPPAGFVGPLFEYSHSALAVPVIPVVEHRAWTDRRFAWFDPRVPEKSPSSARTIPLCANFVDTDVFTRMLLCYAAKAFPEEMNGLDPAGLVTSAAVSHTVLAAKEPYVQLTISVVEKGRDLGSETSNGSSSGFV